MDRDIPISVDDHGDLRMIPEFCHIICHVRKLVLVHIESGRRSLIDDRKRVGRLSVGRCNYESVCDLQIRDNYVRKRGRTGRNQCSSRHSCRIHCERIDVGNSQGVEKEGCVCGIGHEGPRDAQVARDV